MMTRAFSRFVKEAKQCELCPLHKTRQNVVVGRGNPSAKLLFIGEAAGASEDTEGVPFVGPSGRLLSELCISAGIDEQEDCYITNVLLCRPPGNVFPGDSGAAVSARAVLTCLDNWFDRQFELINPSVVVLIGKKALEWVLYRGERTIPSMQEATKTWCKSSVYRDVNAWFTLYHPSYLLRTKNADPERYRELVRLTDKTLRRAKRAVLKGEFPDEKPVLVKLATPDDKQTQLF